MLPQPPCMAVDCNPSPPCHTPHRRNAQVWWIQSVYVRLEHRRRGYYRLLYAHVKEAAQREGAAGLRLYADNSNKRAQAAVSGWSWGHLDTGRYAS